MWDHRFLRIALEIASWSKDISTKVGCVIVSETNDIVSDGYNGFPRGVKDDSRIFDRETKIKLTEHAERNAIFKACRNGKSLNGCTLYVTHTPCTDCAKGIVQSGIKRLVYLESDADFVHRWDSSSAFELFDEVGINYTSYKKEQL